MNVTRNIGIVIFNGTLNLSKLFFLLLDARPHMARARGLAD